MNHRKQDQYFVPAATVVGKLRAVRKTAREISLAAKNAKAIAARAGTKADGFRPITDFIDELGRETRTLVESIEVTALKMSREAVQTHRAQDAYRRFCAAAALLDRPDPAIDRLIAQCAATMETHRAAMLRTTEQLLELLDSIRLQVRAARVISTRSRVEAIRAEEHGLSLNVVSETVETAADRIRDSVSDCVSCLRAA